MGSSRVIIHKSHGEVSLVEQDTIKYVSYPIQNSVSNFQVSSASFYATFKCRCYNILNELKRKNCPCKHEKTVLKSCS